MPLPALPFPWDLTAGETAPSGNPDSCVSDRTVLISIESPWSAVPIGQKRGLPIDHALELAPPTLCCSLRLPYDTNWFIMSCWPVWLVNYCSMISVTIFLFRLALLFYQYLSLTLTFHSLTLTFHSLTLFFTLLFYFLLVLSFYEISQTITNYWRVITVKIVRRIKIHMQLSPCLSGIFYWRAQC